MIDHACLACGKIHDGAREVTLHDGRIVSSYSELWRIECEARSIMNLATKYERQIAIKRIEEIRGKQAAEELRAAVQSLWAHR